MSSSKKNRKEKQNNLKSKNKSFPPKLNRIQHVGIKVHDLDLAVEFYRDVMGMRISDRYEPGDNPHNPWGICFMRSGNLHHEISLIGYAKEENLKPNKIGIRDPGVGLHHIAFEVKSKEEFESWINHLNEHKIEFTSGPLVHSPTHPEGDGTLGENRALYFYDPSGNGIEIFCDMAPIDENNNSINEKWFRDRLEKEGYSRDACNPSRPWIPGRSSMEGAFEKFGKK